MTTSTLQRESGRRGGGTRLPAYVAQYWPLIAGFLLMAIPTLIRLGQQVWTTEAGAHGPIVLATGAWLIYHVNNERPIAATTPRWALVWGTLILAIALYAFSRAYDFISLEVAAVYLAFLAITYRLLGAGVRRLAFPLIYLALVIPPPGYVIDRVTAPLQLLVSWSATTLLQAVGYPIVRHGVTMSVAQYQLLVEDACAGMNSIVGLTAISIFYIYVVHRASLKLAALLVACIIPIAIVTNILRVIGLVLITYYFGDAAAQGFLHSTTGLVLFAVALLLMIGMSAVLRRVTGWGGEARA